MIREVGGGAGDPPGQHQSGDWARDRASQLPWLLRLERRQACDKLGKSSERAREVERQQCPRKPREAKGQGSRVVWRWAGLLLLRCLRFSQKSPLSCSASQV